MATLTEGKLKTNRKDAKDNRKPILPPPSGIDKSRCIHKWKLENSFTTEKVYPSSFDTWDIMKITKLVYTCNKCGEIKVVE